MENVPTKTEYRKRDIPSHLFKYFKFKRENRWILRNTIIWHKPNCMPSSVKDRFTVDYEPVFFFTKSKKYWFEPQYEKYTEPLNRWGGPKTKSTDKSKGDDFAVQEREDRERRPNELGRNKRCVWRIPTHPFPEAHFAVFPEALVETPIKAGCPEFICEKCGVAREKIFETKRVNPKTGKEITGGWGIGADPENQHMGGFGPERPITERTELGYTDCGCGAPFRPGVVLDPFAGSGTTLLVAKNLGRNYIGIELSREYIMLASKRLAQQTMF